MDRKTATQTLRDELNKYGLKDWSVRLNTSLETRFLGLCSYRDKCIILSAHHIDIHPDLDVINTIRHEVAHAIVGMGHGHDSTWAEKAREIGCDNTLPCSSLSLTPEVIDAIRSGADVEVTFDEHVIRTPRYTITRLQDRCEICNKVAVTDVEETVITPDDYTYDVKNVLLTCGHTFSKQIPKGIPFHKFQFGGDDKCQHDWDKNNCLLCSRKRPYAFQLDGMKFLSDALAVSHGAACFDEMGLGKTIQALGVIFYNQTICNPTLHIVKSALKDQHAAAIMNWCNPTDDDMHYPQVVRSSKDWLIPGLKHYIIGYDMLVAKTRTLKSGKTSTSGFDITQFDRVGIKCVVLDECQQIKNVDSTRTQMVRKVVKGRKVIALSGTPWNNKGSELFPVLNMMDPMKFSSEEGFKRDWVNYYWQGSFRKEGGIRRIPAFKEYIKAMCIRRERTEVMSELPLVNRTKLNVVMDTTQEAIYDEAVEEFVKWYEENAAEANGMSIIAAMSKMRHLVALAKIPTTLEYVDEFIEDTERKIVIFAHHKDVQALLYEECKDKYGKDMPVLQFVAGMDSLVVNEIQNTFNQSPRAILVASQLAAGEGLNLQTCCDCVMHERQWNPGKEEQCEGRFVRIGSTAESVSSVYAHMQGLTAIDATLDGIIERKRVAFHAVMNNGEAPVWSEDAIVKELAETIVRAHRAKRAA